MTIRTCLLIRTHSMTIRTYLGHTPLPNLLEWDLEVSVMLADSCDKRGDGDV